MLTPNDVANKKFDKGLSGYKINDVEAFMTQVSDTVITLLKEKADLEQKLETLADKLQEYRQDEESLRTALLGAQKLGDGVIRESKTKAEIIMRDATIKAERMVDNAQIQIEKEKINLAKMQAEVSSFKSRLLALYKQHLSIITSLPDNDDKVSPLPQTEDDDMKVAKPYTKPQAHEEAPQPRAEVTHINEAPRHEEVSEEYEEEEYEEQPVQVERKQESRLVFMNNEQEEDDDEYEDEVEEEAPPVSKYESRFGPLKFGADYDLKREDASALGKKKR